MNHREPRRANLDLLKEVFVCVSIPLVAFALAYITLDTMVHLFLG